MTYFSPSVIFIIEILLFASALFMHIVKKNTSVVFLYILQSLAISYILLNAAVAGSSLYLFLIALLVLLVKVILAPFFFFRLIRRHELTFSASTYLNPPFTLIVLSLILVFVYSRASGPLAILSVENQNILLTALSTIFISFFLLINRKGALSQMIGLLSLENGIVAFAFFAGLEQSATLQFGILFDLTMWIFIAMLFITMIYRQFGTLDVSIMTHLKE